MLISSEGTLKNISKSIYLVDNPSTITTVIIEQQDPLDILRDRQYKKRKERWDRVRHGFLPCSHKSTWKENIRTKITRHYINQKFIKDSSSYDRSLLIL